MIALAGKNKNWQIKTVSKVDLPTGTIEEGVVKNIEAFKNCLSDLREKAVPSSSLSPFVIVNIPEEHAFFRTIEMPSLGQEEMEEAIHWEAESNIPLPIEKVYLAWEILPKKESNKNTILLSAAPKNVIDNLVEALKAGNLIPIIIEPESTALVRSLAQKDPILSSGGAALILDLKEFYTHIIGFDSHVVRLNTISEHSSKNFDLAIAEAFKIKEEEAEKFRQKIGWNDKEELGKKLIEVTQRPFNNLRKDIGSAISFYGNRSDKEIAKILLTSEKSSKWLGFEKYLEKEMGLPVNWQSPWSPQIWPKDCPFVEQSENEEYNICIGLALRKLEEED